MNIRAVTEHGRAVSLRSDGVWEYNQTPEVEYTTFRKSHWGMTQEQVRQTESGKPVSNTEDTLNYVGKIANFSCRILYIFALGHLVRSKYIINETHSDKNKSISDFDELKTLLESKYGKPLKEDDFWTNRLFENQHNNWGLAIGAGHLSRFVTWNTAPTKITLFLQGDNFKVELGIEYESNALYHLEEEKNIRQVHELL